MENFITIPIYTDINGAFEVIDTVVYHITYCRGFRPHQMQIVVNGKATKEFINLVSNTEKYRKKIFLAIHHYQFLPFNYPITRKLLTKPMIIAEHGPVALRRLNYGLLPITKEYNRDQLTRFDLIHYRDGTINLQSVGGKNPDTTC